MMGKHQHTDRKWHFRLIFGVILFSGTSSVDNTYETSPALKKDITGVKPPPKEENRSALNASPPHLVHYFQSDKAVPPPHSDVSLTCARADLLLRVKAHFFGLEAEARELKLGETCQSNVPGPHGEHLFKYPLTACGSVLEILPGYLAYKFVLHYDPSPERFPKGDPVSVDIECRYPRNFHMHQLAIQPTWKTHIRHKVLKTSQFQFNIQLMDDKWENPARSQVFQLGENVNFQVSAPHLSPGQKLYIDSCYATPVTDSKSHIKFTIIDHHGCLMDSKLDPGASKFISQTDKSVRFSMKAFQFVTDPDAEISMHCQLYVTTAGPSPAHKSCTYILNNWEALSGNDSICTCCDSHCVSSKQHTAMMDGTISSGSLWVSSHPDLFISRESMSGMDKMHESTDEATNPIHRDDVIVTVKHNEETYQVKNSIGTKEKIKWTRDKDENIKYIDSLDFKQQNYTTQGQKYQRLTALKKEVALPDADGEKFKSQKPADTSLEAGIKEVFEWKHSDDDDDDGLDGKTWYFAWK